MPSSGSPGGSGIGTVSAIFFLDKFESKGKAGGLNKLNKKIEKERDKRKKAGWFLVQ